MFAADGSWQKRQWNGKLELLSAFTCRPVSPHLLVMSQSSSVVTTLYGSPSLFSDDQMTLGDMWFVGLCLRHQ